MNDKQQKLIEKIRNLMARTTDNGCTEAEAMTAARMAQKLMAEAGLTGEEILAGQTKATMKIHDRPSPVMGLANAVSQFAGVKVTRTQHRDRQTTTDLFGTEKVLKDETSTRLRIVGLEHEVEIASYVLDICFTAIDAASAKALQAENDERASHKEPLILGLQRKAWVENFAMGMAARMAETLQEMAPRTAAERQLGAGNGRSLVAVRQDLIQQWYDDNNITTGRSHSARISDPNGFRSGQAAGAKVGFHAGVGSGQRGIRQIGGR